MAAAPEPERPYPTPSGSVAGPGYAITYGPNDIAIAIAIPEDYGGAMAAIAKLRQAGKISRAYYEVAQDLLHLASRHAENQQRCSIWAPSEAQRPSANDATPHAVATKTRLPTNAYTPPPRHHPP